jgi:ribonuclease HI/probable phosphoglycerate mutase
MGSRSALDRQRLIRVLELLGERLSPDLLRAEFPDLTRKDVRSLFQAVAEHIRCCEEWADSAADSREEGPGKRMMSVSLYCDGASRGNPGPSGAGVVLLDEKGEQIFELSRYLDNGTNNEAEYRALARGLEAAADLGVKRIEIFLDSELVVRQLSGKYKVRNPRLRSLFDQTVSRLQQFDDYAIFHVGRELNQQADRLAKEAIDRGLRGGDRETYRLAR